MSVTITSASLTASSGTVVSERVPACGADVAALAMTSLIVDGIS